MPSSPITDLVLDRLYDLFDLFEMYRDRDLSVLLTELGLAGFLFLLDLIEILLSLLALLCVTDIDLQVLLLSYISLGARMPKAYKSTSFSLRFCFFYLRLSR